MADQLFELLRARVALVDHEVRVLFGYHGIANAIALQSRGLNQARGVIAGRIPENRTTAPFPQRLGLSPQFRQCTHAGDLRARTRLELQLGSDKPFLERGARCGQLDLRARNAAEELTLRKAPVIAAARDARARHAGLTVDAGLRAPLDAREGARRGHDHATDTAIAHQQIAAQTDPVDRYLGRQRAQERSQILDVARTEEHVGRTADTP